MSIITLRDYHLKNDALLDSNSYIEVIFNCTHILESFPKSIKTYQQFGQALLEAKRFNDAAEVFTKILSVLPDDFFAHAGLSEIYEENRDLDKAIWHMERAFETQPSNQTIQDEFRRLISKRDGSAPSKIRLTRGALIRMYAKGELFQQAIAEAEAALQTEPNRVDLKLLLAKLHMQTNDASAAEGVCKEILNTNPYCQSANQIMMELASSTGTEVDNDDIYLQRLSDLDPYYAFIENVTDDPSVVPAEKVSLDLADYIPTGEEESTVPDWVNRIGIPWNDGKEIGELNVEEVFVVDTPDEYQDLADTVLDETDIVKAGGEEEAVEDTIKLEEIEVSEEAEEIEEVTPDLQLISEEQNEEIPDWISKAGWIRASDESASELPDGSFEEEPALEELPGIDANSIEETAAPAEELPDWLKSLNPEGEDSPQVYASTEMDPIPQSEIPPLSREMLSELLSLENNDTEDILMGSSIENQEQIIDDGIPTSELLHDIQSEPSDDSIPDLPDWLKDLDTSEIATEVSISEINSDEIDQSSTPVVAEEPANSDFVDELGGVDLLSELESEISEEVNTEQVLEPQSDDWAEEELSLENILSAEDTEDAKTSRLPDTADSEKKENKPVVPSWVKNILSASDASLVQEESSATESGIDEPSRSDGVLNDKEESIEELITDLPDKEDNQGVISQEVTGELESWLDEVSIEEEPESFKDVDASTGDESGEQVSDISFETLSSPEFVSETDEVISEIEPISEEDLDESGFEDRFSSMFDTEKESERLEDVASVAEVDRFASVDTSEKLINLLKKGEFEDYLQEVMKSDLSDETSERIISELTTVLQQNPDIYELWQNLGDFYSMKSDLSAALTAYLEAEKHLFS